VFVLWFAGTIGVLVASIGAGGIRTIDVNQDPNGPRLESEVAYEVLGAGEPIAPSERMVVVISGAAGAATDPAFQANVHQLVAELAAAKATVGGADEPTFDSVIDPFSLPPAQAAGVISPDGSTVQVVGNIPGESDVVEHKLVPVPAIVDAARARSPQAQIHIVSGTFLNRDFNDLIASELDGSLRLTIPLTFVILLVAFGAIVAALVPLVLATTSLAAGYGLLGLYSQSVSPVSANAAQLLILMGLAVAVDYSLFMVTRFRSERQRGSTVQQAIETSSSTAGRAVFFSGIAVVISLGGLLTLGISLFTSMAVGTMGVVAVSVIGSLTFLPATMAIVGDRVNMGRPSTWVPRLGRALGPAPVRARAQATLDALERRKSQPPGTGFWARLVNAVMSRPVILTVLSGALLLAIASPALRLRTGTTDIAGLPSTIDGIAGIKLINEKFPFGQDIRMDVVVTNPTDPAVQIAIGTLISRVDAIETTRPTGRSSPRFEPPSCPGSLPTRVWRRQTRASRKPTHMSRARRRGRWTSSGSTRTRRRGSSGSCWVYRSC